MAGLLDADHPLNAAEDLVALLDGAERIEYSQHFEQDRLPKRGNIDTDLIKEHLEHPSQKLEGVNHEPDEHPWPKYILLFDKSNKYWLRVVISFREQHVEVVTAHIASKRKNAADNLLKRHQ